MDEISIRQVEHDSAEYRAAVALRQDVLRAPLGLTFDPAELRKERDDVHVAAFQGGKVVGCLVLTPQDAAHIKLRQVAVAGAAQGRGVGKKLVLFAEEFSRAQGFCFIMMHARETVLEFYEKMGYKTTGTRFFEVSIPHWKMQKGL